MDDPSLASEVSTQQSARGFHSGHGATGNGCGSCLWRQVSSQPIFFTQYGNKPVSEASRNAVSKVNDFGQYRARDGRIPVAHGMRTAFKSWGLEHGFSDMVTEIALGHVGNDQVARAYTDTNMKGERQRLMDDWSRFVLGHKT